MPDELLDIIDDNDIVITQDMRTGVHLRGLQHRGVHVFLVTPEGKLLVQRRSKYCQTFPLALDCTISEHVKSGESYQKAAIRGMAEEMGICGVRIAKLVKFKMVYGPNDIEISILYEGSVDPTLVRFDPLEVEGIAYYSLDELEGLIQSRTDAISGWFEQLFNWYTGKPAELNVLRTYKHKRLLTPYNR
ncbi:MAG: hypothetical protein A2032_06970 [Chloroflexi bacterium RBG_19FT_COMBO_49_13]|nr:MAG: hypothetical protein A2032_06970 [Chloroflexi bacterium RBG_19FT_COMBO_49_13]